MPQMRGLKRLVSAVRLRAQDTARCLLIMCLYQLILAIHDQKFVELGVSIVE